MDCRDLRDDVLDVLYGEASPASEARVRDHVASCGACRAEMDGLSTVRRDLQAWAVPPTMTTRRPRLASAWRPALAWAASVALAFGGGLVFAGMEMHVANGRLRLTSATEERIQKLIDEQEARHRAEIESLQARAALPSDEVLRHIDRLVAESEARQTRRVEGQLVEFARRVDGQRRDDFARVNAGLALLEGQTNHDLARATELMGYVLQAAHEPR